jgi:hypothetical protein
MSLFLAALLITAAFPSMAAAAGTQQGRVTFELEGSNIVVDKSGWFSAPRVDPPADAEGWNFDRYRALSADIVAGEVLELQYYIALDYKPPGSDGFYYSLYDYADFVEVSVSPAGSVLENHESGKFAFQAKARGEAKITLKFAGSQAEFSVTVKDPEDAEGFDVDSQLDHELYLSMFCHHFMKKEIEQVPFTRTDFENGGFRLTVKDSFYNARHYYPYPPDSAKNVGISDVPTGGGMPAPAALQVREAYMAAAQGAGIPAILQEGPAPAEVPPADPIGSDFELPDDIYDGYMIIGTEMNKMYIIDAVKNGSTEFSEAGRKEFRINGNPELKVGPVNIVYYYDNDHTAKGIYWRTDFVDNKLIINNQTATAKGKYRIAIPFWYKGEAYMYHDILDYSDLDREIDLTAEEIVGQKGVKLRWSDAYGQEADVSILKAGRFFEGIPGVKNGDIVHNPYPSISRAVLNAQGVNYCFEGMLNANEPGEAVINFGERIVGKFEDQLPEWEQVAPGSSIEMYMYRCVDEYANRLIDFWTEQPLEGVAILTEKESGAVLRIPLEIYGQEFTLKMPEAEGEYAIKILVGEPAEAPPAPAAPTASPAAGSYSSAQSVKLATATEGADIYYTVDGSEPSAQSTKYSSAISVSKTTAIKAVAVKGGAASPVAEFKYTISAASNGGGGGGGWGGGGGSAPLPAAPATPAAISSAAVSAPPAADESGEAGGFADVAAGEWYYEAVSFVVEKGIAQGVSGTEFSPQGTVTRAQFITMLCRAYGIPEMEGDSFADAGDTWYSGYLAAAKQLGISAGVGDNLFAPEQVITREQMMAMLYNYFKSVDPALAAESAAMPYSDAAEISSWAVEGVAYGTAGQWVKGKDGNRFDPQGIATRAELAQIFYNILTAAAPATAPTANLVTMQSSIVNQYKTVIIY